jgi:hypothetical protein
MSLFIDYLQVAFSEDSDGDNEIYNVGFKCFIMVEFTDGNPDGATDNVRVYSPSSGDKPERILTEVYGASVGADLNDGRARGQFAFNSSDTIRVFRNNESTSGILHVFRLPEAV